MTGKPNTHNDSEPNEDSSVDVDQAAVLFAAAGFDLSPRTVSRWCERGKLICELLPIDRGRIEKYFISRQSIDEKIEKMRKFADLDTARHGATRHDMASHDSSGQDTSTTGNISTNETLVKLQEENLNLRIDNKAKEQVITRFAQERREHVAQLTEYSREIGRLETKVLVLEGPKATPSETVAPKAEEDQTTVINTEHDSGSERNASDEPDNKRFADPSGSVDGRYGMPPRA